MVHYFAVQSAKEPSELKKLKIYTWITKGHKGELFILFPTRKAFWIVRLYSTS